MTGKNLDYIRSIKLKFIMIFLLFLLAINSSQNRQVTGITQQSNELPTQIRLCGVFPIVARPDAGPDRRDGFLIAIDEINSQVGPDKILPESTSLVPLVKDDQNNAAGAIDAANSCVNDGAHLVIGSTASSASAAIASVLNPLNIIQISYASSSPALSDREVFPFFMRNVPSDADEGFAVADLVNSLGLDIGAIIHTDDSYGSFISPHFKSRYLGNLITEQNFTAGASNVTTEVQALADANPEFVLLHAIDTDARTVLKNAFELGIAGGNSSIIWILTSGSTTTATFIGDVEIENAMQNAIGTNVAQILVHRNAEFEALWDNVTTCGPQDPCGQSRTGKFPNSYTRFAYDAVYIAAMGIANANTVDDVDLLLTSLYDVSFIGAGREYEFNDIGEVNQIFDFVQLRGTTFANFGIWSGSNDYFSESITLAQGVEYIFNLPQVTSVIPSSTAVTTIIHSTTMSSDPNENITSQNNINLLDNFAIVIPIFGGLGIGALLAILVRKN